MNPLLPALGVVLCFLIGVRGIALMRSVPVGAVRVIGLTEAEQRRRESLLARVRATLGRRFGRNVLQLMSQKRLAVIRHRIDAAGRPGGMTIETYGARKAATALLYGALGVVLTLLTGQVLLIPALLVLGWVQVDFALGAQARRRQSQIERDLPDFLDVLVVTVQAGLGFRDALGRVADALGGPMGQECRIALQQMGYGAARRTAFEGIRERSDSESLSQFMTALLQAEELGAPLGDALSAIADDMRKAFGQRARREAAKAVPRISAIVVVIIMPAVLILLLAAFFLGSGADYTQLFSGG